MSPAPEHLVEAVLLVSPRPVRLGDLSSATGLSERETKAALENLSARYSPEGSGIVLRAVAGGHLLSTNPACAEVVERFREEATPRPRGRAPPPRDTRPAQPSPPQPPPRGGGGGGGRGGAGWGRW